MKQGIDPELLQKLPKVDLHIHFDGSLRPQSLLEIAREQGIELPAQDAEGLLPYMQAEEDCQSLVDYLSKFELVLECLQTAGAIERAAYEVVERAAEQRCLYVEVRIGPQLHRTKGLSLNEVMDAFLKGLERGEMEFGVTARGISACLRNHTVQENIDVIESAVHFLDRGLVAVDLAGSEAAYPPELHTEVFARARKYEIPITIHAGEAAGADSIRAAVTELGADRIGHGVRLRENEATFAMIKERRIPLEMCPVSNIQTKASDSWENYPIRDYFEQGIVVTVNTDNMTVSGTDITNEYRILTEKFGFTPKEIRTLILNGVEAAFLDESGKRALRERFIREFEKLGFAQL
jgi:adenosine deaminase